MKRGPKSKFQDNMTEQIKLNLTPDQLEILKKTMKKVHQKKGQTFADYWRYVMVAHAIVVTGVSGDEADLLLPKVKPIKENSNDKATQ